MDTNEFIDLIKEELEIENMELDELTPFKSLDIWDSMAILILISLVEEFFKVQLKADDFKKITCVQQLTNVIGVKNIKRIKVD